MSAPRTIGYNALRRVDGRIEEVRIEMAPGEFKGRREVHVGWHDDPDEARASIRKANGVER